VQQIGDYFLSVSIQDINEMSRNAEIIVVLLECGLQKFVAIKLALATRMFNMLVTDHRTAQKLAAMP